MSFDQSVAARYKFCVLYDLVVDKERDSTQSHVQ